MVGLDYEISIHAPRVGSDLSDVLVYGLVGGISIHAPRVGSDILVSSVVKSTPRFQSTLPVWGATNTDRGDVRIVNISIHAPRVGSDTSWQPHLRMAP